MGVSDEVSTRMLAAGITVWDAGDVRPSPNVWHWGSSVVRRT